MIIHRRKATALIAVALGLVLGACSDSSNDTFSPATVSCDDSAAQALQVCTVFGQHRPEVLATRTKTQRLRRCRILT